MSYTKGNISKNIADRTSISLKLSQKILEHFLHLVTSNSHKKSIKIHGFGTFNRKITPSRIGRNPKSGEIFKISERTKLNLVISNIVKKRIN
jgi:nucleoid DNA-binding protein